MTTSINNLYIRTYVRTTLNYYFFLSPIQMSAVKEKPRNKMMQNGEFRRDGYVVDIVYYFG